MPALPCTSILPQMPLLASPLSSLLWSHTRGYQEAYQGDVACCLQHMKEGVPPPLSTCLQPCMRNEQVPVREWGSCQGCCLSLGQMYSRWVQQAEAPIKGTSSDFVWRHVTIIYKKDKVILQYWSYSAASKMTGYDTRLENLSWNHKMLHTADGEALKSWFVPCRSSEHLPQHLCSQTVLEQSQTTSCTNSRSSHTCIPYSSRVACFTVWTEFRVLNLAWKILEGLTLACQKDCPSPHKKLLADEEQPGGLLLHSFPSPSFT